MKIQLLSDLHFETMKDNGDNFIDSLDPTDVDVLVMAGDIMYLNYVSRSVKVLKKLLDKYNKIIYVIGNHEAYTSGVKTVHKNAGLLRDLLPADRIFIFDEPGKCQIDGQHFVCGSMWYRFDENNKLFDDLMNDKSYIKGFIPWVYEQNELFEHLVNGNLTENDIVITHYLPSYQCVSPQFKGQETNRFFVCEMDKLIMERKPKLWLHGHTHTPLDIMIGDTRVVCNPHGYRRENYKFNQKLIIEV